MRVGLFLACEPSGGGTFQYSLSWVKALEALKREGHHVVVLSLFPVWEKHLHQPQVEFHFVRRGLLERIAWKIMCRWNGTLAFGCWLTQSFGCVGRKLRALSCDLWIFPSQDSWGFRAEVPALVAIHDLMHRYERVFPEVGAPAEYHAREFLYGNICRASKGILVDSHLGKTQVRESYGRSENVFVLPYIPPHYVRESFADVSLPPGLPEKFIFYPAQFWEHKNHKRLIEALSGLRERGIEVPLVLVGSQKNGYDSLVRHIRELKLEHLVKILGYVDSAQLVYLYKKATALVMPTFFGPTNIPPLEAITLGCPVAVSGIYGMKEQMGEAAVYFDPLQVSQIAEAIRRLWTDEGLRAELIAKGLEHSKLFTQEAFNERAVQIIRELKAGI